MEDCSQINYEFDIKIEEDQNCDPEHGAKNIILTNTFCPKSENEKSSDDIIKFCSDDRKEKKLIMKYTKYERKSSTSYKLLDEFESTDEYIENSEDDWTPNKKKGKRISKVNGIVKPCKLTQKTIKIAKTLNKLDKHEIDDQVIMKSEILNEKPNEGLIEVDKLTCVYCGLKATFRGNLRRHIKHIHLKQEILMCTFCNYQTSRRDHLKLHINMKHTKKEKFKCTFCDFEALSPNTLKNHLNHIHTLHRWYNCKYCEFKTTHSGNLKVHIQGKHQNVEFQCHLCNFVALKKFHLSVHIDQVHESEKLKCSFCNHVSKMRSHLTKHIRNEHPTEVKFKCELCDYRGYAESNVKAHMVSKHQDGNQYYMCTDCDATYDCFANLKKHRNVKHT
ncbi:hypothetical protein WA026_011124 [Henosepilachna vigintioctopunctata]|uniref:C2H2-type domain-containing protein n=1 Tax=Henosepilachna vigintioctopunctata TaxID=420089 RepID=A0AAW1U0E0_9CUCU